jgi:hypothetical protein
MLRKLKMRRICHLSTSFVFQVAPESVGQLHCHTIPENGKRGQPCGARSSFRRREDEPRIELPEFELVFIWVDNVYNAYILHRIHCLPREYQIASMNVFRAARPLASRVSSFAPSTIPRFVRAESTGATTYENIVVSSPKPGVGLSMCSAAGRMSKTTDNLQSL